MEKVVDIVLNHLESQKVFYLMVLIFVLMTVIFVVQVLTGNNFLSKLLGSLGLPLFGSNDKSKFEDFFLELKKEINESKSKLSECLTLINDLFNNRVYEPIKESSESIIEIRARVDRIERDIAESLKRLNEIERKLERFDGYLFSSSRNRY